MFAKLTEQSPGVYVLPVVRTVGQLGGIREDNVAGQRVRMAAIDAAERRRYGWVDFQEETVSRQFYKQGVFEDVLFGNLVKRGYPNKTFQNIASMAKEVKAKVNVRRLAAAGAGVMVDGNVFPTDVAAMSLYAIFASDAAALPVVFDVDGEIVPMTMGEWKAFLSALVAFLKSVQSAGKAHYDAIDALTNPLSLVDYDVETGWPVLPTP